MYKYILYYDGKKFNNYLQENDATLKNINVTS
jgi:hypothetical protein